MIGPKGTEWKVAHRSKEVRDNLNPIWDEDKLDVGALCGGDLGMFERDKHELNTLMSRDCLIYI